MMGDSDYGKMGHTEVVAVKVFNVCVFVCVCVCVCVFVCTYIHGCIHT
jgi:hypothetical protein